MCLQTEAMFGSFTRLFKRSASRQRDTEELAAPAPVMSLPETPAPAPVASFQPESGVDETALASDCVTLPFASIFKLVPKDLHGRLGASGLGGVRFSISKAHVIEQLPQGSVKVKFGELRQAAPSGAFITDSSHDGKLIDLPLGELMRQIRPDAFVKRASQKRLEVPDEVSDLFGQKGQPLSEIRVIEKKEALQTTAVAAEPVAPPVRTPIPAVSARTAGSISAPAAKAPAAPAPPAPAPTIKLSKPIVIPPPAPAPVAPVPAPKPKAANRPAAPGSGPVLVASLASVSEHWPEGIRGEIQQLGLANATCEFPVDEIGPSLRTGRVQCRWKQIRSWIQPPVSNHNPSSHAETTVELPLKILAPLYVEHCRSTRSPKKASVAENIPDVFSKGTKKAAPAPAPAPPEPAAPPQPTPVATKVPPPVQAVTPDVEEEAITEDAPPIPTPPAAPSPAFLSLPLSLVSETWPDQVRRDVDVFELADAKLEVPFEVIEEGLKQGRLSFRWRQVCLWIRPAPSPTMTSANLETQVDYRVDLPLNFVAPLYLQQRSANAPKKLVLDEEIPDVFNPTGLTPAEAPASEEPAPAVCAAPTQPASRKLAVPVTPAKGSLKPGEGLAELFGEPAKRNWTPNDIVHKTATLPGVAGAMIALQDGLLVASCMPPAWKSETIAAFLPQIFGRMRQYTNEFKMGELGSVAFTVEEGALQVFNAGIIYFAALSKQGASLPIAELTLIAKEIGRHTK